MKNVQQIKTKDLTWVNITKPGKQEIEYLKKSFNFHDLDLKDCLPPIQRPKLFEHNDYIFMILQFPVYNRKTREVTASEIDFFINQNTLVTVHSNELLPLKELFELCVKDEKSRAKYLIGNPGVLIYEILNHLLLYCFPMLNHINLNIDNIEKQIFQGKEKAMVHEILIIKRNIINFRKTMQGHKRVIKKLIERAPRFFSVAKLGLYFHSLIAHTKEIWDSLENYKESIDALHNTNESLISFKTNEVIKTLTVFSVIVFPLTLIASIFGMNVVNIPLMENPYGFFYILSIMLALTLAMFIFFKRKKWL